MSRARPGPSGQAGPGVTRRTVSVGEVDLAIAEAGGGGRPVLLLHGFTGAKEDFTEWLEPLAGAGWHAVAPDHRGHGESSHPDGTDAYSLATLAADALALTGALGWSRFVLLGHSMGGFVAQLIALEAPDRLDGLVLMDTAHGPLAGLDLATAERAGAIALAKGMDRLADLLESRGSELETPAHRRVLAERPDYAAFGSRKLRATSPHLYAAIMAAFAGTPDRLEQLRALDPVPPTLVIVGEQDTPFLADSERLAGAITGARLAVLPDAGHSPQFENPQAWWTELSAFLARLG